MTTSAHSTRRDRAARTYAHRAVRLVVLAALATAAATVPGPPARATDGPLPAAPPGTVHLLAGDLGTVTGLTHDAAGDVYVAQWSPDRVSRIDATTGKVSTVVETSSPRRLAMTPSGHLLVQEGWGVRLLELLPDGRLLPRIGPGSTGAAAALNPHSFAVAPDGSIVFRSFRPYQSRENAAVYRLSPDGSVSTVAGGNGAGYSGDGGPALQARVGDGGPVTVAPDGTVYLGDGYSDVHGNWHAAVRRVDPRGVITTVLGPSWHEVPSPRVCDGVGARDAELSQLQDLRVDPQGRLLLGSDWGPGRVQRLGPDGTLTTVLGRAWDTSVWPFPRASLGVPGPTTMVLGGGVLDVLDDGRLLVDEYGGRVLSVAAGTAPGVLTVLAGTGDVAYDSDGDGGPACDAALSYPTGIARGPDGSTYVADYLRNAVRRIAPDGTISTVAGTGRRGSSGDGGPAALAELALPRAVAVDPRGRLLIADVVNDRVRRVDLATGIITTVAGTGAWGHAGDGGPATRAQLAGPHGLAVSPDGTIWVADTGSAQVRRIAPDGTITTVLGTGTSGDAGDGGPGTAAQLSAPRSVAVDAQALYVSDPGTSSVRRLDLRTGTVSTLAGPTLGTPLVRPAGLLPTPQGLLVAEAGGNRVVLVTPSGAVRAVAGSGSESWGDASTRAPGRALEVALRQPQGLAPGPDGRVLVADTGHHQVLELTLPPVP